MHSNQKSRWWGPLGFWPNSFEWGTWGYKKIYGSPFLVFYLSNGHSPANLSNSSTRQKFASFGEFEYSPKWPFWKIGRTRYIRPTFANHFPRTRYIRPTFANHFARTRQTRERQVWQLLHEFSEFSEFGEFSECRLDRFIHKNIFFCI
jgi:hypothetical protein